MIEAWYRTKEWLKIVQQQAAFEQVENQQGRTCWLRREGMMRHNDNAIVFLRPASLERGKPILASGAFDVNLGPMRTCTELVWGWRSGLPRAVPGLR